jgi:AAA domain/Bifunctional DNA primase/polymerase, N-terminal
MINGAYDAQGPFLRTRGYYVHPIAPGTKAPGYFVPSENAFRLMENWNHPRRPMEKTPQPGAGIGLRCGLQADGATYIIAVDYDDDDVALLASEDPKLWGIVQKRGARGATAFFRSSTPVPSKDFKIGDRMVVQILGDGKQTVLPGSVHPDTGKPYAWWDERSTLYNHNPADLSESAEDLVARIDALLAPFGHAPEPKTNGADGHYDDHDQFQVLNNAALRDLEDWVPELGLYDLKRQRGAVPNYDSVASFRPSLSGKKLEDRNLHLKIRRGSIKDFGENKGYSPIQLVMACLKLSFGEAVDWLRERVMPKVDADFDAIIKNAQAKEEAKEDPPSPEGGQQGTPRTILQLREWLARKLKLPDFLLGWWLTTTSRVMLFAPTGIGKSMLAVAMGFRAAEGKGFLHWAGRRKATVLYIDAEMARRLLQERLADEVERSGTQPEGFHAFSHEDDENFSPLNSLAGQQMVERLIKQIGNVDLIIFDNIMSLMLGDMKDEESWRKTFPWVKSLTKRCIGQIWIHHTGHDETHAYGTKTREWSMDTVIQLEKVKRHDTDVSFQLSFTGKARERRPDTRRDFTDVRIALVEGEWTYEITSPAERAVQPTALGRKFFAALADALNGPNVIMHKNGRCVNVETWRRVCVLHGLIDEKQKADSARALFSKHKRELIACNLILCRNELVWMVLGPEPTASKLK